MYDKIDDVSAIHIIIIIGGVYMRKVISSCEGSGNTRRVIRWWGNGDRAAKEARYIQPANTTHQKTQHVQQIEQMKIEYKTSPYKSKLYRKRHQKRDGVHHVNDGGCSNTTGAFSMSHSMQSVLPPMSPNSLTRLRDRIRVGPKTTPRLRAFMRLLSLC